MAAKRSPERGVTKGQVYCTRPKQKGAQLKFVQIVGVSYGQQPKATYRQITKAGKAKSSPIRCWLTWSGKQWTMSSTWELMND